MALSLCRTLVVAFVGQLPAPAAWAQHTAMPAGMPRADSCASQAPRRFSARRWPVILVGLLMLGPLAGPANAQLASRAAEEWIKTLDSPNRVSSMKIAEMIGALKITPGQIVADVGAGSGLLSGPLAIATGPTGVMYAVDIDKGLLTHIEQRAADQKLANIKTVLGEFTDPKLPATIDLAFMNDVLHHIEDRATYLRNLARYLKPGGRMAIVDFVPSLGPHRTQPELTVSEEQAEAWLQAAGLRLSEKVTLFDDRFYIIYVKP